jgi:NDP-sugar pyrophosphorylase family protein/aminoglycoside/choline kinase family phosphotransferase
MKPPERAIVLAAGFGTRLQPLTLCRPKPLMPVWGTPVLRHVLDLLRDWGVRDVLINLHHGAGPILNEIRLAPPPGLRCSFSFEPDILGTGGALRRAAWFVESDQPLWIMNADVLGDLSPWPLLRALPEHDAVAALWLDPVRGPRTVDTAHGLITSLRSATPAAPGTATFCGLQLVSPRLFRYLPSSGFATLVNVYEAAMRRGERIAGVTVPGAYWSDIGTPADYRAAHRDTLALARLRARGGRFARLPTASAAPVDSPAFVAVSPGTVINPGAQVRDSVLWENVTLRSSARVTDAIIGDGLTVIGRVAYMAVRADRIDDPLLHRVIRALGWSVPRTTVLPLPPRGSARTFTRLRCGARSAMLIRYSLERAENGLYTAHARFLRKHGLRVPRVLLDLPEAGVSVMEDAGDVSLQDRVPAAPPSRVAGLYRDVLTDVIALHDRATRAARRTGITLCPPFSRNLYDWEQNLFHEQFLIRHVQPTPAQAAAIGCELRRIIPPLLRVPQTLVHRDLQSSNVLLAGGHPVLIDFQGMRFGAPAYDLASLLCDPYVGLPASLRQELLAHYVAHAPGGNAVAETFDIAAVERLVQALGAFGRLGALPGTKHFLRHIPAAVRELLQASGRCGRMPVLVEVLTKVQDRLPPQPSSLPG